VGYFVKQERYSAACANMPGTNGGVVSNNQTRGAGDENFFKTFLANSFTSLFHEENTTEVAVRYSVVGWRDLLADEGTGANPNTRGGDSGVLRGLLQRLISDDPNCGAGSRIES
jgi:hypothetical protein